MTRTFSVFAAAFVVTTGLFGAWMLTSTQVSEAAPNVGINISQLNEHQPVECVGEPSVLRRHVSAASRGS